MNEQQKQEAYFTKLNTIIAEQQTKRAIADTQTAQASAFSAPQNNSLIMLQLDVEPELDKIFHLLSGDRIGLSENGSTVWLKPEDDRERIFSEYGVKQIMNLISFYINKNTLLSYYDLETIKWTVRDFAIALSDLIYNRREAFFYYPSPEELFDKYWPTVQKNDLGITKDELYNKCIVWSHQELESKQNHYESLCLAVIHSVHSTYLRALGGRERDSLRKQFNVMQSDSLNGFNQPQKNNKGGYGIP